MVPSSPSVDARRSSRESISLADLLSGEVRFAERHHETLSAMDVIFGLYNALMLLLTVVAWLCGEMSPRGPLILLFFLISNALISVVSRRIHNPIRAEVVRAVVGAIIAPLAFLSLDGPLSGWWPGFLIMCLGGCIVLPLITQRPLHAMLLVIYYLAIYTVATVIGVHYGLVHLTWYGGFVSGGIIFMTGMMYARIVSLLGRTLRNERERTIELAQARDALFAEVEVAHEIQTLLLPQDLKLPGALIKGCMLPAAEVGGDYYDLLRVGARTFLAVGDVSGHGVTSGLAMMMARANLLGALAANPTASLSEVYRVLNYSFSQNLERMGVQLYMTFALIEVFPGGQFAAVGRHLPIMIYRHKKAEVEELELDGMWLGVLEDLSAAVLPEARFQLDTGDVMVLYTDGIVEHMAGDEMFGFERLKELIRIHAPRGAAGLIETILEEMEHFSRLREDDITLLVVDQRSEAAVQLASASAVS